MSNWDVIVVGLGGVGSASVYHLAEAGHRVLGIDQYPPAHAFGSSHGRSRIIRQAYFEHPSYVPLLKRSYQLWDELQSGLGKTLFHKTGLVETGPADGVVIPGILRSAKEHDLSIEVIDAAELSARWPGLRAKQDWAVVIEQEAGFLNVEACVKAHLDLADKRYANCLHECKVVDWEADGAGVRVTTDSGEHTADRLIIAAGPWSSSVLKNLDVPLQLLRKHQYWYHPQSSGYEMEEGFPCFFHDTGEDYFYGFPSKSGCGVKVARHSGGTPVESPAKEHSTDRQDREKIEAYLSSYLPDVGNQLVEQRGCYYTVTPDEHFVLDRLPGNESVTLIAGLSGHGFKFASVLGEIASQLATGQPTPLDIDLFRIDRFLNSSAR